MLHAVVLYQIQTPLPRSQYAPLLIAVSFVAACAASICDFITFCSKLRIVLILSPSLSVELFFHFIVVVL